MQSRPTRYTGSMPPSLVFAPPPFHPPPFRVPSQHNLSFHCFKKAALKEALQALINARGVATKQELATTTAIGAVHKGQQE